MEPDPAIGHYSATFCSHENSWHLYNDLADGEARLRFFGSAETLPVNFFSLVKRWQIFAWKALGLYFLFVFFSS